MELEPDDWAPWRRRMTRWAAVIGAAVAIAALLVLVFGWWLDITLIREPLPGGAMKANNALISILIGIGIVAIAAWRRNGMAILLVIVAGVIAGVTLIENLLRLGPTWLDELLSADLDAVGATAPGRMGFTSAIVYLGLSLAVILWATNRAPATRQTIAMIAAIQSYVAFLGWLMGSIGYASALQLGTTAMNTALAQFLLAMAVVLATPDVGWVRLFRPGGAGLRFVQVVLPIKVLASCTVAIIVGELTEWDPDSAAPLAVIVLSLVMLFTLFIGAVAVENQSKRTTALIRGRYNEVLQRAENLDTYQTQLPDADERLPGVAIARLNPDGTWFHLDPVSGQLLGTLTLPLSGRPWWTAFREEDQGPLRTQWTSLLEERPTEPQRVRTDGNRWLDVAVETDPSRDTPTLVMVDVGPLVRLEEDSQRAFAAWDSSAAPMVVIDKNARILMINEATVTSFGYTAAELDGRNVKMLMPEPYHSEHDEYLARYRRTGEPHIIGTGREVSARRKDGSTFPIFLTVSEFEGGGTEGGFVGIMNDISEIVRLRDELTRSNRDLEQFAYLASHDLQAPARNIRDGVAMLATSLESVELDEMGRQVMRLLDGAGQKMQNQIQAMLSLSRLQRAQPTFVKVDLGELVAEALNRHATELADAEVHVGDRWPTVTADDEMLSMILENFISNALKYRDPQRSLRLDIRAIQPIDGTNVRLDVTDNGIGIDQNHQERIFTMFQRLHTDSEIPGTGIGLALAQRAAAWNGGRVVVTSEGKGRGSTFSLILPLHPSQG